MPKLTEDQLCNAFASKMASSPEFCRWVILQTKFFERAGSTLLVDEQAKRPAKHWWRHWWCQLPDGSQSETDIFMVFEDPRDGFRFALHIECKLLKGKFTPDQWLQYARRAEHMMGKSKYLSYRDYATILLAPMDFATAHPAEAGHFDSFLSFEIVDEWVPEFA